jgi:4-hydroxythreonine-4-phosphate dehydrogenase
MGDPAGIGPELCLRALAEPAVLAGCVPVVFGDEMILRRVSAATGIPIPEGVQVIPRLPEEPLRGPAILNCLAVDSVRSGASAERRSSSSASERRSAETPLRPSFAAELVPAKVSAACGAAAYAFIEQAIAAALTGRISAVVTAPIHKESLHLAGVPHPGHTEIFTTLTRAPRSCMMLWSPALAVSMVTTHIGYHEVPGKLSAARILDVIELTAQALTAMHGRSARLAICGLNPHAGEHGLFGQQEEERFIAPAVAQARARGIQIEGPLPPDTAFTTSQRKRCDGIVTLYHDQGHIPFKMLAFEDGVNVTLGLPIVRTSVDHGTAFDIAWRGVAQPTSLFSAIACALRLAQAGAA